MKTTFRFDIIANFIRQKGLVKNQFCRLCGISTEEFEKMQNADNSFRFDTLCKIAVYMDVDLFNFFLPYSIPSEY